MKTITIVGFGRFSRTLLRLLSLGDFQITIYVRRPEQVAEVRAEVGDKIKVTNEIDTIYDSEVVFFSVPISAFEDVVKAHKPYFKNNLLIDVLSVKMHPAEVFTRELTNTNARAIATHPMFGPDSSKNGFKDLPFIIHNLTAKKSEYDFWLKFLADAELKVIELSPEEHDKQAAYSQGVTHFIGRVLKEFDLKPTEIDSLGAKKLHEIMVQTCNDTWELFNDLQNYNPYTKEMRAKLTAAIKAVDGAL